MKSSEHLDGKESVQSKSVYKIIKGKNIMPGQISLLLYREGDKEEGQEAQRINKERGDNRRKERAWLGFERMPKPLQHCPHLHMKYPTMG